jgi:murein DD-endopeptidase MepM/ murein hydrolase activator NlpD
LKQNYQRILPVILILGLSVFATIIISTGFTLIKGSRDFIADEGQSIDVRVASVIAGKLHKDGSLMSELLSLDIPTEAVNKIIAKLSKLFDLKQAQTGDEYKVYLTSADSVLAFEYKTKNNKKYRLNRVGGDFLDQIWDGHNEKRVEFAGAVVETDLWDALVQVLPDPNMFARIAEIYAGQIDLFTDTNPGDTFKIVFEGYYSDGDFVRCGDILGVEYILAGKPYRAFQYTDPDGYSDYYDEHGYSLRRAMLKSPLDYRCITSRFSYRRLHPILKTYRPHLGVDFAAAPGTPVVAAGDGTVIFRGRVHGFGNYLEIQHDFDMTTNYGHLQKFADGTMPGQRVVQGQIIGYVGSSGEATGPHLDYRVKRGGQYVNPLKMTLPAMPPVKAQYLSDYRSTVAQRVQILKRQVDTKVYVLNQ